MNAARQTLETVGFLRGGRIGGFLWYNPVEVKRTGVTTADVPATYVDALTSGVEESSVASALSYVANLEAAKNCQLNPSSGFCAPTPGSSTTTAPPTTAAGTTTPTTAKVP